MSKHSNHKVITKSFDQKAHNQCKISRKCDPIQFDPTRSNLIEKLTKVRLMPVRMKLSPWVRLKNNHYYCLRLQRASLIIKFILDHFSLKQQLSFSLLVLHMWCFNEFFCAALTLFNVLWLKSCSLCCCFEVLRKTVEKQVLPAEKRT